MAIRNDKSIEPADLEQRLRPIGCGLIFFDTLDSTNDWAKANGMTIESDRLPLLIVAANQTAGRGRGSNRWQSAPGSLTCSLLTRRRRPAVPSCDFDSHISLHPIACGLAVASTINRVLGQHDGGELAAQIKWPNDIVIGGKKVAGQLVETVPTKPERLVTGLGCNVNNLVSGDDRISLRQLCDGMVDVGTFCKRVTEAMLSAIDSLNRHAEAVSEGVLRKYSTMDFLQGKTISLETPQGPRTGRADGIDPDGRLRLWVEPERCESIATATDVRVVDLLSE